ncbi:MAG: polyhydroxyalkanoate synthesis regulator DNA-binding domain-containing protein [Polyangia bacterium]
MLPPRVIKRYANRKLYDTQSSQYVTLDQIAQMIRAGEEVKVLDNSSKEDLTSVTLAQIIFEEEKKQKSFIPLGAMRHLIQSGGASLQELAQQAQARVLSVFRKGEGEGRGDGMGPVLGSEEPEPLAAREGRDSTPARELGRDKDEPGGHLVREFLERSQHAVEEWQRRADDRVRQILESLSPFAAIEKEVARLQQRVEQLEARLNGGASSTASDTAQPVESMGSPDTSG